MEYVTIARKDKNSENWFIGNTAGETDFNSVIKLDFLDKDAKYEAIIYSDAKDANSTNNQQAYTITKKNVTSKNTLKLRSVAGGGYAITIKKL